jgi:hypothetical protein
MSRRAGIAMSPAEQRAFLRHAPRDGPGPRREEMPVREGHPRDRFPLTLGLTPGAHDFLAASPTRRKTRWALPPRIFPTSSGR